MAFWPTAEIDAVIHKYLLSPLVLYRKTTHLWVTVPDILMDTIEAILARIESLPSDLDNASPISVPKVA